MPSKNQEASTCADALVATWISTFGVSHIGSSDRGTQFCSPTWKALCSQLGMEHVTTHTTPKATVWWIMSADKSRTCLRSGWPGHSDLSTCLGPFSACVRCQRRIRQSPSPSWFLEFLSTFLACWPLRWGVLTKRSRPDRRSCSLFPRGCSPTPRPRP